jgi:hypothetical protein
MVEFIVDNIHNAGTLKSLKFMLQRTVYRAVNATSNVHQFLQANITVASERHV